MPIYEYKCTRCGSLIEVFQKVNDPPLEKCTKCAGLLKKILSPPAIQFKGNGWYLTDYARKDEAVEKEKQTEKDQLKKPKTQEEKKEPSSVDPGCS